MFILRYQLSLKFHYQLEIRKPKDENKKKTLVILAGGTRGTRFRYQGKVLIKRPFGKIGETQQRLGLTLSQELAALGAWKARTCENGLQTRGEHVPLYVIMILEATTRCVFFERDEVSREVQG